MNIPVVLRQTLDESGYRIVRFNNDGTCVLTSDNGTLEHWMRADHFSVILGSLREPYLLTIGGNDYAFSHVVADGFNRTNGGTHVS